MRNSISHPGAILCISFLLSPVIAPGGNPQAKNQQAGQEGQQGAGASEEIVTMDREELYEQGISIDSLLGGEVVDASGNEVGEVEDFVLGADHNRLVGLIVETGGFLNIGDNHLLYPFKEASIKGDGKIQADIKEQSLKELSLFKEIEGEPLRGDRSRVSELIGGLAYSDGEPYGRIDDVIVNDSGDILAVVVQPDVAFDDTTYSLWPFAGYYNDTEEIYDVPKDERFRFGEEPFDAESLRGAKSGSTSS